MQRHQRRRTRRVHRHRRALPSPSVYATRPDSTLPRAPGQPVALRLGRARRRQAGVVVVHDARRTRRCGCRAATAGSIPARSNASHDTSSSNRCCGSIASASRGQIPKNPASNTGRVRQEPTLPGITGPRRGSGHRRPDIPAPIRGEPADRVDTPDQQPQTPPEHPPHPDTGSPSPQSPPAHRHRHRAATGAGQRRPLTKQFRQRRCRPTPPASDSRRPAWPATAAPSPQPAGYATPPQSTSRNPSSRNACPDQPPRRPA